MHDPAFGRKHVFHPHLLDVDQRALPRAINKVL